MPHVSVPANICWFHLPSLVDTTTVTRTHQTKQEQQQTKRRPIMMMQYLLLLSLMAPWGIPAFTLVGPTKKRILQTRILYSKQDHHHHSKEDNGGLDAYAKALEAAYGAAKPQPKPEEETQDWVEHQVQAFLDLEDTSIPPQHEDPTTSNSSPEASSTQPEPTFETDLADDFIALKNDIEQYVFTTPSLFPQEEEPTTGAATVKTALEQFAQEIDTPLVEEEFIVSSEQMVDGNVLDGRNDADSMASPAVLLPEEETTTPMEDLTNSNNEAPIVAESLLTDQEETTDEAVKVESEELVHEIPVVAEFSSIEEAKKEMFAETTKPDEMLTDEPILPDATGITTMESDTDAIDPVVAETEQEDLNFAFSEPESVVEEATIDDQALDDLVNAIEEFGKSNDAETLVAALEANPLSETPREETNVNDDSASTARIVDVSDSDEGPSMQVTTRSPVAANHDDEPPAVFKFLGSLSKDLQEHTKKKIPEELKPLADIAGNLWSNAFGKFQEAVSQGSHSQHVDAPSEVFYFNLNTQEGEWDPTSEDITKAQMLSNEQGKSWTATIDSRGNFYVHYYDSEDDMPAPQLIATDSTWDQFSNGAGRVYYVNRETGASQWEEPKDFGVEEKTVYSLNEHLEKELTGGSAIEEGQKQKHHGKNGFHLPTFFENIAAKSRKPSEDDAEKEHFEPKPPKEAPNPNQLRP